MVAKISTQIVSFFLLPLYTALLTTIEYGRVDIYTSLAMIIVPFLTLQVEMALFRFFIGCNDKEQQKEIVSSSYFMVAIILIFATMVYFLITMFVNIPHSGLLYGYYFSQTISALLLQTCRANGDNISYGSASFISSALAVILNVFFVAILRLSVEGILLSAIIAQFVSSVFMIFRTKVYQIICLRSIKREQCLRLLQYSVPLVFNQIASWAINYSDRLIILLFWGEGINGIYSIANKFSNITNTFFNVYNVAWTENVVRSMNDEDNEKYISHIFELTFNLYLMLVTGIINILPFIFGVLIDEAFASAYQHVPILLIAMLFSGMAATLGSIYIAYGKTKNVSVTTTLAGICNVIVHFSLINKFELFAASISTLISFVALFIYRYIFIKKFFKLFIHLKNIIVRILIMVFAWFAYAIQNPCLILIGLIINLISIIFLIKDNKEILSNIIVQRIKRNS